MMRSTDLEDALRAEADPARAKNSAWFFKTAPGQYGHGDKFLGVRVPVQRQIARRFMSLEMGELENLLHSAIHEQRLTVLIILVEKFKRGNEDERRTIYNLYLRNTSWINNWDLVDSSAGYIVGAWLLDKDYSILRQLAKSKLLWERRIAMIATQAFINNGQPEPTIKIAKILLHDQHDLIHKAVGWMLREVGKRIDQKILEEFLLENGRYKTMPRMMLRYAIERLPESRRKDYLSSTL